MRTINFTKMNGAGNDFIVIDSQKNGSISLTPDLIRELCDRRKGIGADGVLFIEHSQKYDYLLKYFNSDGYIGSLCANGSRCSINYAAQKLNVNKKIITFECKNEIYEGEIIDTELIKFRLKEPKKIRINFPIKIDGNEYLINYIDTGSPHVIIFWEGVNKIIGGTFKNFDLDDLGRKVRYHEDFSPEGTNVNVVLKNAQNEILIRTYERGVENETYSCGTGTVAAAIILYLSEGYGRPLTFVSRGNDKLIVDFVAKNEKINKITLTGPAKFNYIGSYNF